LAQTRWQEQQGINMTVTALISTTQNPKMPAKIDKCGTAGYGYQNTPPDPFTHTHATDHQEFIGPPHSS